jgi:hypothetical protein
MDLSQFFAELKSRNIRRLGVAYVTAGLLLIELAAILLAIFEAAAWEMKVLVRAVASWQRTRAGQAVHCRTVQLFVIVR